MMNQSIAQLVAQLSAKGSENEVVEFKEAKPGYDFHKLGKYFSALINEAKLHDNNQAWLILGIKDKGKTIVGSQFRANNTSLMKLKNEVALEKWDGVSLRAFFCPSFPIT